MEMGLEFEDVEFSTAYGDYIASFAGEDGTELLQLLTPLWWAFWQKRPSASLGSASEGQRKIVLGSER